MPWGTCGLPVGQNQRVNGLRNARRLVIVCGMNRMGHLRSARVEGGHDEAPSVGRGLRRKVRSLGAVHGALSQSPILDTVIAMRTDTVIPASPVTNDDSGECGDCGHSGEDERGRCWHVVNDYGMGDADYCLCSSSRHAT